MKRSLPGTPLERGLELLSLVGLLGGALLLVVLWPQIPAEVPGHYGAAGSVTYYAPKGSLWGLVAVNAGLYVFLSLINLFPQAWNLPGTPKDRPRQLRLAQTFVRALKAFTIWLFAFVLWMSIRVAQGAATGLSWWFLPLSLFAPFVIISWWLVLAKPRSYKGHLDAGRYEHLKYR